MSNLIIVRGLSGSGKSTLAKTFVRCGYTHIETDMYYEKDCEGDEELYRSIKPKAAEWCLATVGSLLRSGQDVVLAGVFATNRKLRPYTSFCASKKHHVTVVTLEAAHGSIHKQPAQHLQRQKESWESLGTATTLDDGKITTRMNYKPRKAPVPDLSKKLTPSEARNWKLLRFLAR